MNQMLLGIGDEVAVEVETALIYQEETHSATHFTNFCGSAIVSLERLPPHMDLTQKLAV